MGPLHTYQVSVDWTGAGTKGTESYTSYGRDHVVVIDGKPALPGSADPAFRGDEHGYSPEELFVAALAQCHMLWFLHRAAVAGVVVTGYSDRATGTMRVEAAGVGQFTEVALHPKVSVAEEIAQETIADLHQQAHDHCYIARSVNFPVRCVPATTQVASPAP
ncbi:OsmC family protein [Ruania suaedae]|uniref:OsmC family protein n=1 Tax=Ruania suaedae TaxID=2897774 RepID=UPI001E5106F7|nr:OsmC family protein [Ruania suaedae]UFU04433.1 OsmC family protein [Ruania suaedae]